MSQFSGGLDLWNEFTDILAKTSRLPIIRKMFFCVISVKLD